MNDFIDWSLSLAYIFDSKTVGIYLLSNINCEKEGRGLRGEALAVLKSHIGKRFYEQFIQYIKQEYDFDYIWGQQIKNRDGEWKESFFIPFKLYD